MAGKFDSFENDVKKFNKDHGVDFSFEKYEIQRNKTSHMRSFFSSNENRITVEDFAYREVVGDLFKEAVESLMAKRVASVDHAALLKDFDKLMDNYRGYCDQTNIGKPKKNGGWTSGVELLGELQNKIRGIPEDKSDFIKDKYINRSLRLRDMRADLAGMEKDGKAITAEELSRAMVYQKALEKTIKERSSAWRAFHWFQGPAEKRDLKAITEFIKKYSDKDVYKKAEEFANENVIGEVKNKLEKRKEEIKAIELLKPRKLKDYKQANERMTTPQLSDHVHKQILGFVEKSPSKIKSNYTRGGILEFNHGTIRKMWVDFEKANTPATKEAVLHKYTQTLFKDSFDKLNALEGLDEQDKMVAAQKITNLMLKQYSPITSDEAYKKYADNYVIRDEKFMGDFMIDKFKLVELKDEDLRDVIHEMELVILTGKEKIDLSDIDKYNEMLDKSDRYAESPQINAHQLTN